MKEKKGCNALWNMKIISIVMTESITNQSLKSH